MNFLFARSLFVLLTTLWIFIPMHAQAKVLIMTHCYNRPEFIYWQAKTFNKFVQNEYEFVVFNDAPNETLMNQTNRICRELGIQSIRVPQHIHYGREGPSVECGDTIQYMYNTMAVHHPDIVLLIDSDMFLIRQLDIEAFLKDHEVAAYAQHREGDHGSITYMLPNLLFFNMPTLPDKRTMSFDLGSIDGVRVDTAGFTWYYVQAHPYLKWLKTNIAYVFDEGMLQSLDHEIVYQLQSFPKLWELARSKKFDYEFYNDFAFLHFRAGSNWYAMEAGQFAEKTRLLSDVMEELIKD